MYSATIDRIDPAADYIIGNVQLAGLAANLAKDKYTNSEMAEFIKQIVRNTRPAEKPQIRHLRRIADGMVHRCRWRGTTHEIAEDCGVATDATTAIDYLRGLWARQGGICAITGVALANDGSLFSASADRIDSATGYLPSNIQLVCRAINYAKNSHDMVELSKWLEAIKIIWAAGVAAPYSEHG